jgi:hypothetical protein
VWFGVSTTACVSVMSPVLLMREVLSVDAGVKCGLLLQVSGEKSQKIVGLHGNGRRNVITQI